MKSSSIIKAGVAYVIGSFFAQGLRFVTLPLFSRMMTPIDYGYIASYELWIAILTTLIGIQTSATIANAYIDYGENKICQYTSSVSIVGNISFLICGITAILSGNILSKIFELDISILLYGLFQSIGFYFVSMLTAQYRIMDKVLNFLYYNVGSSFISIVIAFLAISSFDENRYIGYIFGFFVSYVIFGIIAGITIYIKGKAFYNKDMTQYALKLSTPLLLHSIAGVVSSRINQIIILKMIDANNAGIYNFTNNFAFIVNGLYTAFNQAYIPWYYKQLHAGNKDKVKQASEIYISMFTSIVICIIMVMPEVIKIMGSSEFSYAINIVAILLISTYVNFLYTFPVNYEFYKKKTMYIAIGTIFAATCNIIFNIVMIKMFGIIGAAIATCMGSVVLLIFHCVISKKIIKGFELRYGIFIKNIITISVCAVLYYVLIGHPFFRICIVLIILTLSMYRGFKFFHLMKE